MMMDILYMFVVLCGVPRPTVDGIEWFAGVATIVQGMREQQMTALGYDILKGPHQDILSDAGFATAVSFARETRDQGLQHWATVCSSWVWVAWDKCGRNLKTPMGGGSRSASRGNKMVSRMALVAMYLLAKGCSFLLEQPSSS